MSPKKILRIAEHKKLDALAITDHNTIAGGVETLRVGKETSKIMIIIGAEIATSIGDIIGLFLNEEIKSRNVLDVIDEIKSQDGLVLIPHPFKGHKVSDIQSLINRIDLLEGCNSRHSIGSEQIKLLKTMNKPLVAGSDAHFPQEIGLCQNIFDHELTSIEEIKKSLMSETIIINSISSSPIYLESISQIIKGLRCKNVRILGIACMNLIRSQIYNPNE
jgi:hypothetical protein